MKYLKYFEHNDFFDDFEWDDAEEEKDIDTYYLINTIDGSGYINIYISTKNKKERGKFNALKFGTSGIFEYGVFRETKPILDRNYKLIMNDEYHIDYIGDNGVFKQISLKELMDKYDIKKVIRWNGNN